VLFEADAVTAEDVAAVGRPSQSPNANKVAEIEQFDSTREAAITALAEREMLPHYETLRVIFERFTAAARELKLEDGVVTFADVELLATELLARERDAGIKPRFSRVFVDEFQDVNALQQRLVELVSGDSYYAVGDAAQSIYGFRGSEVELIRNRERELAGGPGIVELRTNYRSVAGVLEVNNRVHGERGVKGFKQLEVGSDAASPWLPVELIAVDVGHEDTKSLKAKDLEDAAIAIRIKRLIDDGEVSGPGAIAVLARARTALPGIADALRRIGVSAVIEGGGGLWDRPEIDDIVALLAITGNPNDEERLLKVLRSPMAGLSVDALVLLARAARRRKGGGSIWLIARDPQGIDLAPEDAEALASFVEWFTVQREFASRRPIGDAIEACLVETGYDLHLLGLVEGERRFANVRALQMFAAQWEAEHGRDLRAFADEAAQMAAAEHADDDQEAVVEQDGDSTGSVRLLTMHGSKGLEFDTVVLPRLGSNHRGDSERLRVSSDGARALMTRKVGKQACVLFDQQLAESQSASVAEER
jgi:ATP-dependent helicase/nuclease subunit A